MKRAVVWSDEALADTLALVEWIAKDSVQNAGLVVDRIQHSVGLLAEVPFGRVGRVFGTYEAFVPKAPFIIVYQLIGDDRLAITRIIHTARDWPPGGWPADDHSDDGGSPA